MRWIGKYCTHFKNIYLSGRHRLMRLTTGRSLDNMYNWSPVFAIWHHTRFPSGPQLVIYPVRSRCVFTISPYISKVIQRPHEHGAEEQLEPFLGVSNCIFKHDCLQVRITILDHNPAFVLVIGRWGVALKRGGLVQLHKAMQRCS